MALFKKKKPAEESVAGTGVDNGGALDGFKALERPVGREQVLEAAQILQRYKEGKTNLERRIIDNAQWYKMRHWDCLRNNPSEVEPVSGWLFNSIANKHADAMDNFPEGNVLPREEGDKAEAKKLSAIVPVIFEMCDFEEVYSRAWDRKLEGGTGVYGAFWDASKLGGLGDIAIRCIDVINLFWEPGISDIQDSRHLFHVELRDNDLLEQEYPQLKDKLGHSGIDVAKYVYDDTIDTSTKSAVVDWYYHKMQNGRKVLHYCKFVNDEVLYATENDTEIPTEPRMIGQDEMGNPIVEEIIVGQSVAERGWYDHGLYPFVFDPLFREEGTPCGFGYIDVAKSAQEYIDRGNQAIMQNMLANARPRHFIRSDGAVNEKEYADMSKDFIHVDGNLGQDSILPVQGKALPSIYVEVINNKIDELKETTGNRDVSTGGTTSGVTAASAIAAMQEAGGKLSRDNNKAGYRAFRRLCLMVIELIRQFYDTPRCFRIMGENGAEEFVNYSNAALKPQAQGTEFGVDMGYRTPLFDVQVTAQKASAYTKMAQNEMALQFFGAGFFNPQLADQALACLDMMDFNRKDAIMQRVARNGGMHQQMLQMQRQMLQLAQIVDKQRGSNLADQIAAGVMGGAPVTPVDGVEVEDIDGGESKITKNARTQAAAVATPE